MPVNIIIGSGAVGGKFNVNAGAVGRTGDAKRAVENNAERRRGGDDRGSDDSCWWTGGRDGEGVGVDTRALCRLTSFNGDGAKWRDWSVFRSYGLVDTSLTTLPHAEADRAALVNRWTKQFLRP